MPTAGPSATVLRNLSSTSFGGSLFPAINRADARLRAGCRRSPIRTNSSPLDLLSMIVDVTEVRRRLEEGKHARCAGDEHRDDHADQQRPHLPPHGVMDHPRVAADQRVLQPPDEKSIPVDLRARSDLRRHVGPHQCPKKCSVRKRAYPPRNRLADSRRRSSRAGHGPVTPPIRTGRASRCSRRCRHRLAATAAIMPQRALPLSDLLVAESFVAVGLTVGAAGRSARLVRCRGRSGRWRWCSSCECADCRCRAGRRGGLGSGTSDVVGSDETTPPNRAVRLANCPDGSQIGFHWDGRTLMSLVRIEENPAGDDRHGTRDDGVG